MPTEYCERTTNRPTNSFIIRTTVGLKRYNAVHTDPQWEGGRRRIQGPQRDRSRWHRQAAACGGQRGAVCRGMAPGASRPNISSRDPVSSPDERNFQPCPPLLLTLRLVSYSCSPSAVDVVGQNSYLGERTKTIPAYPVCPSPDLVWLNSRGTSSHALLTLLLVGYGRQATHTWGEQTKTIPAYSVCPA